MRVIVCGGRNFTDRGSLFAALDALSSKQQAGFSAVIHGAARGADRLAGEWAEARGIPCHEFPANWEKHGRAAGFVRNMEMLKIGKPDAVIAFPGGAGTLDMIELAEKAALPIHKIGWENGDTPKKHVFFVRSKRGAMSK